MRAVRPPARPSALHACIPSTCERNNGSHLVAQAYGRQEQTGGRRQYAQHPEGLRTGAKGGARIYTQGRTYDNALGLYLQLGEDQREGQEADGAHCNGEHEEHGARVDALDCAPAMKQLVVAPRHRRQLRARGRLQHAGIARLRLLCAAERARTTWSQADICCTMLCRRADGIGERGAHEQVDAQEAEQAALGIEHEADAQELVNTDECVVHEHVVGWQVLRVLRVCAWTSAQPRRAHSMSEGGTWRVR